MLRSTELSKSKIGDGARRHAAGFTLVEVVVVIAVVALLSAIIVPVVARQIDSAKRARAKNECQVIASAILKFYSDVGLFPASSVNGSARADNNLARLVSGTAVIYSEDGGPAYGYISTTNDDWYDDGTDGTALAVESIDLFDNHLNSNTPIGSTTVLYPTSGEFRWRGPYLARIDKDPWGRPYVCNIDAAYSGSGVQCVVMSAGPNGDFDTAVDPASTVSDATEDDIWSVVVLRR